MMGINELGWIYDDVFIQKYEEVIMAIRKINPNAIIYVQSILPVSQKVSTTHNYIHNEKIQRYNQLLLDMCNRNEVYYVNIFEDMVDENNALPEVAAFDGIHLKKEYCEKWLEYLLTHTIQEGSEQ